METEVVATSEEARRPHKGKKADEPFSITKKEELIKKQDISEELKDTDKEPEFIETKKPVGVKDEIPTGELEEVVEKKLGEEANEKELKDIFEKIPDSIIQRVPGGVRTKKYEEEKEIKPDEG